MSRLPKYLQEKSKKSKSIKQEKKKRRPVSRQAF